MKKEKYREEETMPRRANNDPVTLLARAEKQRERNRVAQQKRAEANCLKLQVAEPTAVPLADGEKPFVLKPLRKQKKNPIIEAIHSPPTQPLAPAENLVETLNTLHIATIQTLQRLTATDVLYGCENPRRL